MTRFGKKLVMVGIWAGVGMLIGLQFGGGGPGVSGILPDWSKPAGSSTAGSQLPAGQNGTAGTAHVPAAGSAPGGQAYVYVPVTIDPVTGAYTMLPMQQQVAGTQAQTAGGTGSLPQQEVKDYSALSPEQILIPEEQKPTVDVLADKTAGLLQQASQKGIRWVVSLFDSSEE
ncbi:hypothetical protein [Paenibacillus sp. FSL R7-0337]|uniref:hypothetical protein n=1 Tax=Paenibacillus sp. FSL R7-0337 TaxID=1926588 RepID=UPI00096E43C9|nr:hypothetical protein [Paenibacillus sp. FSL R7-0337]OMG00286.1 hypothetical protein BK147_03490 [Paenibacillus sp. FSL R7-0337]